MIASLAATGPPMADLGPLSATVPDLLRLLAVPVLGWAAWRDVQTRRVADVTWLPLFALGLALFAWEGWIAHTTGEFAWALFSTRAVVSLGVVIPLAYLFWRIGGFGGADAKALFALALFLPGQPTYFLGDLAFPLEPTPLGVLSLTVLSNAVVLGACYPVALFGRNLLSGRFSPNAPFGTPIRWDGIEETHGRLLTGDGLTGGADLDTIRMYLVWRGISLAELREDPEAFRETIPVDPNPPGDGTVGSVHPSRSDGGRGSMDTDALRPAIPEDGPGDPWGAATFLADVAHTYGTTPDALREGLAALAEDEEVWVSPGIPFIVPIFAGLVVGLGYGDVLFRVLVAVGLG